MNGKERVNAALNKKKTDRMPFIPCIDPYFRSGLAHPLNEMDIHELQACCHSDMLRGLCCYKTGFDESIKHEHHVNTAGEIIDIYNTPVGTLHEVHKFTEQSPYIPFPTEHLIKTVDDLRVYRYLLNHICAEPDYTQAESLIRNYDHLMVSCSVEDTAFRQLLTKKIGVENFTYFYFENPSEVDETIDELLKYFLRLLEISVQGPADVFICYENTNISNSSPEWFEKYELPQLNRYADLVHQYGKKFLVHMCGRINLLRDRIAEGRFDGIIDVAPHPTGDLDFEQAVPMFCSADKIIAGGIDCTAFVETDMKIFRNHISEIIGKFKESPCFMLGSGDAVPKGATAGHFKIIAELLEI